MSWVPPATIAPNAKSAVGAAITTSLANAVSAVTTGVTMWLSNCTICNSSADQTALFYIADGSGNYLINGLAIPPNGCIILEWPFVELTGCQWKSDTASVLTATLQGIT